MSASCNRAQLNPGRQAASLYEPQRRRWRRQLDIGRDAVGERRLVEPLRVGIVRGAGSGRNGLLWRGDQFGVEDRTGRRSTFRLEADPKRRSLDHSRIIGRKDAERDAAVIFDQAERLRCTS